MPSRRSPFLARLAAGLVLLVAAPAAPAPLRAQVAPDARWTTLRTPHFRVTYEAGLDDVAAHAARRAEAAWAGLAAALGPPPRGVVDMVLSDDFDFPQGFATPTPSNRIYLYTKPPIDSPDLDYYRDWVDLLVVHELTHVFHLDRTSRTGRVLRDVFGRPPLPWPFFPAVSTPGWSTEGLAVAFESRLTGAGRNEGTYNEMILRTAVLEDRFAPIDRASSPGPVWPAGNHAYVYGSKFEQYLARRFGDSAAARVVDATATAALPPPLFFDRIGERALGRSFTGLWSDWHDALRRRYSALADSLRAGGAIPPTELTGAGRYAAFPRVSPAGRWIAYAASTGRDDPATWLIAPPGAAPDSATGRAALGPIRLARRDQDGTDLGPASWLPDGTGLITAQLEFDGPYRLYSDLFALRLDRSEERLTRGLRLSTPDVASDGRRVVAVQTGEGATSLVLYDLRTAELRTLVPPRPGVAWALPRWSPDGRLVAVSRWSDGGYYDVVVLDTLGAVVARASRDYAVDRDAAWSPDGRFLLWSSDRSGVPNIYARAVRHGDDGAIELGPLRQATHVLTGVFQPDVSPDGKWLYLALYHADGYHIARTPFDPAAWGEPRPTAEALRAPPPLAGALAADAEGDAPTAAADSFPRRPYSPLATLRPRFWLPYVVSSEAAGTAIGLVTGGRDVVGRHEFALDVAASPSTGRVEGALSYRYAGLGNPLLDATLERNWDVDARIQIGDGRIVPVLAGSNRLALSATLLRPAFRSSLALTAGVEGIVGHRVVEAPDVSLTPEAQAIRRWGVFGRVAASDARGYALSISRERGGTAFLSGRYRWDAHPATLLAERYGEVAARVTGFTPFHGFGFAHHVLAVRAAALLRTGDSAPLSSLGGAPGGALDVGFGTVGGGNFLSLRGFPDGVRVGTRGWSASLEYRVPITLVDRGNGLAPYLLESLAAAAFLDAGDAWCAANQQRAAVCNASDPAGGPGDVLAAAGVEVAADVATFFQQPFRVRVGVGVPLGISARPRAYAAAGVGF